MPQNWHGEAPTSRLGSPCMYFGKSCYYDTAGRRPGILLVDEILPRPQRRAARAALFQFCAQLPAGQRRPPILWRTECCPARCGAPDRLFPVLRISAGRPLGLPGSGWRTECFGPAVFRPRFFDSFQQDFCVLAAHWGTECCKIGRQPAFVGCNRGCGQNTAAEVFKVGH
jgi:hypothetical protein